MNRQPLREIVDRGFGGRISRDARQRTKGSHRRDIENHAVAAFCHVASEHLTGQYRTHQIQITYVTDSIEWQIKKGKLRLGRCRGMVTTRSVDQNIDWAKFGFD